MRSAQTCRRRNSHGFTLVEVMVSILLIATIVVAAMGARYLAVRQARRGDAHNTAGKIALLLLEGWRSTAAPSAYDPVARFSGQMTINDGGPGPDAPAGFTTLDTCHIVQDNVNYYATLAYIDATETAPAVLHVTVGFRHQYQAGTLSETDNFVRLTTYD